jgi:hypothetical protein
MLQQAKIPFPTIDAIIRKANSMDKHKKYTLTETDINAVLSRNRNKSTNQKGGAILHDRHLLVNQRDIALRAGNEEEVARINGQLKSYSGDASEPSLPMLSTNSPVQAEKKVSTFDERRKQLAAAAGSSAPKALANKTSSAQNRYGKLYSGLSAILTVRLVARALAPRHQSDSRKQLHQALQRRRVAELKVRIAFKSFLRRRWMSTLAISKL